MLVNGSKDILFSNQGCRRKRLQYRTKLLSSVQGDWAVSRAKEGVGRGRKQGWGRAEEVRNQKEQVGCWSVGLWGC